MKARQINTKKVSDDFENSYELFHDLEFNVTVFGSARTKQNHKFAKAAYKLSYNLSKHNINIVTGGGNGIMKAANKGAYDAKASESIGLNIQIPNEQSLNAYTTKNFEFNYFFTRKLMLLKYSKVCIVFPGGFGTLDEFFEVLTLMQTKKISLKKIYLYNSKFWGSLLDFIKNSLLECETISKKDLELFELSDDLKYIENEIVKYYEIKKCEL